MIGTYIFATFTAFVLAWAMLTIIPGYKERDWVIYRVCLPALAKYHEAKKDDALKNAVYERTKCLHNVWEDKQPLDGFK